MREVAAQFQLTFDDYLEALKYHFIGVFADQRSKNRKVRSALRVVLIVDVVLLSVVGAIVAWMVLVRGVPVLGIQRHMLGRTALTALPIVPWLGLIVLSVVAGLAQKAPRYAGRWAFGAGIAFIALGCVQFYLANSYLRWAQSFTPRAALTPFTLANLFGWIVLVLFWLLIAMTVTRNPGKLWEQQPNLHVPKSLQFREDGFRLVDENHQADYQWSAIHRIIDTPKVLLLYLNAVSFHIVPKRAFAEEGALGSFWNLVPERLQANTRGFPVFAVKVDQTAGAPLETRPPPLA